MVQFALDGVRAPLRCAAIVAACLGGVALAVRGSEVPRLAASTNQGRADLDGDGLTDVQEQVLGTRTDLADSDGDSYSDLEERARGSLPLDRLSLPSALPLGLGTVASVSGGHVSLLTAVYVDDHPADLVDVRVGIVYRGRPIYLRPSAFALARGFVRTGKDTGDSLAVFEIGLPEALVRHLGQVDLFSIVNSRVPGAEGIVVSVVPLVDFSGVTVAVEGTELDYSSYVPAYSGGGTPTGITYRPLVGDDGIPSTWNGGEMCYQRTAAVGVEGVSIVHEVESASCQAMDTYCNPVECAASVGKAIRLPDPGALAGG